jgi:hypothetical protein
LIGSARLHYGPPSPVALANTRNEVSPMLLRRCRVLLAAPVVIAVLLVAGCSSDRGIVARVGARTITVADFKAAARGAQNTYPGPPDSAKVHLLQDLVKRELLLNAAEVRGLFRDTLAVNYRRLKEEEYLAQMVSSSMVPATSPVSDAEVAQLYAWRDSLTHLQVIYLFTRQAAQLALDEVRRTGDFGAVANRFNPPGMIPNAGDLGEGAAGGLVDPIDGIARTAPVGSVTGPVQAVGQGWFLVHVVGRRAQKQPPLEEQRAFLAQMLQQRKQRIAAIQHHLRLREMYALELVPGGSQMIFAHANSPGGVPPTYTAEELARPLMRWVEPKGPKIYRFADALADLNVGGRDKPNTTVLPAIDEWLLIQGTRNIQVVEGKRRAIPDDPNFRRMLDENVNGYVIEGLYVDEVANKSQVGPDDARRAYEMDRSRYQRLVGATVDVIDFADSASAMAFGANAGQATTLRGAAALSPNPPEVKSVEIHFPSPDPDWERLESTIAAMQQGQALGPYPAGNGYRVFQLISREVTVTPYEALDEATRGGLQQMATEVARERRLEEYLQELRGRFHTELYPERLKRVAWPVGVPVQTQAAAGS